MHNLSVSVAHNLEKGEAEDRVTGLLSDLKSQHSASISDLQEFRVDGCTQFSFRLLGLPIRGRLLVDASRVTLEGTMPPLATAFKGVIEEAILAKAKELLS